MKQVLRLQEEPKGLPRHSLMPRLVFSFITSLVTSNLIVTVIHWSAQHLVCGNRHESQAWD